MIEAMSELPAHLRRTITWDRGSEMATWHDISLQLRAPVYFCDPHSPWQRGSNENTNRLLRFWFEKGTDLSGYTHRFDHRGGHRIALVLQMTRRISTS